MVIREKMQNSEAYLVNTRQGKARILDAGLNIFFPDQNASSALAQGYWEAYTAKEGELEKLIAACKQNFKNRTR